MKLKRIAATVLSLTLMCGAVPFNNVYMNDSAVFAEEESEYTEGTYGVLSYRNYGDYIEITDCDYDATDVEIPSEIDGVSVTSIGDWAFSYCDALTSITIPDSVTSIGDMAFSSCDALTSITIPDSVSSIGNNPFNGTPWLEAKQQENPLVIINNILIDGTTCEGEIVIPEGVTSIGGSAFDGCSALTSITIPDSVTSIRNCAFSECTALTSITIPDSVTSIGDSAFYFCTSLTSVTIPDSVTSIEDWAFYGCSALTEITIPDSVTSIGGEPFEGTPWFQAKRQESPMVIINDHLICGLTCEGDCIIPDGVIKITSKAFSQGAVGGYYGEEPPSGANITSVRIPGTVKEIDSYAFMRCEQLKEVIIHDGVENIDAQAFLGSEMDSFLMLDSDCDMEFLSMAWTFGNTPTVYVIEGSDAHTNAKAIYMESLEHYDEETFKIALISDLYGDIDTDGEVNSSDASSVLAEYAKTATGGEKSFSPVQTIAADVNHDGAVDSSDASSILAYYAYTATGGTQEIEDFLGQ